MEYEMPLKSPRIEVVDALRGFAVMAIMFLHNIEHFNFYEFPEVTSDFMKSLDKGVWDTLFFLFSGKAYAIFSLLFGFSFFIQYNNQVRKGKDFRLRFLWRLCLLFVIGCFNGAFFPGDILVLYAIIGVVLILVCRWSDRAVLITAVILIIWLRPSNGWCITEKCIHSSASLIFWRWSNRIYGMANCSAFYGAGATDAFSRLHLCSCWVC